VKSARGRKPSSKRWLERQLNAPYVREAKRQGYRSRAAFKLKEIDERFSLLKPGQCIVDLGAAPGGWCQIAALATKSAEGNGRVIGVDIQEFDALAGVESLIMDFMDPSAPAVIHDLLAGQSADIVLSDMAAPATGHRQTDHLKIMALLEAAFDFATEILTPGGVFLGKVLQGGTEAELLSRMKRAFAEVRHVKPKSSRSNSAELYVLATGYRPSV
ncbi:MAG: RlmE family RNA methyltransferase, partial [Rhizobiales bacterium]|nr:RlmE family RNA methyltransferase [Hyphomicrobiales bacterium]